MSKTIDLTISDRVAIGRYINLIRCTLPIRLVIDEFNDKFVPTMDELKRLALSSRVDSWLKSRTISSRRTARTMFLP